VDTHSGLTSGSPAAGRCGGGPICVERIRTGLRMRQGGRRHVARCGGRRRCATRGGQRPRGRLTLLSDRADQTGELWAREHSMAAAAVRSARRLPRVVSLEGGGGGPIRVERVCTGLRMRRGGRRRVARCGGPRRYAARGGPRPRGRITLLRKAMGLRCLRISFGVKVGRCV
jgi:hypothetical protein